MENREDVLKRLRCIEGHTRGVARMVDSGTNCLEIVRQIHAINGGLDKVSQLIIQSHLMVCIPDSLTGGDPKLREGFFLEVADLVALSKSG